FINSIWIKLQQNLSADVKLRVGINHNQIRSFVKNKAVISFFSDRINSDVNLILNGLYQSFSQVNQIPVLTVSFFLELFDFRYFLVNFCLFFFDLFLGKQYFFVQKISLSFV